MLETRLRSDAAVDFDHRLWLDDLEQDPKAATKELGAYLTTVSDAAIPRRGRAVSRRLVF